MGLKARLTKLLIDNDPLHIVQTADLGKLKSVKYYIDCGDNDHVTIGNATLHILMTQRHIPHTFIMRITNPDQYKVYKSLGLPPLRQCSSIFSNGTSLVSGR